MPMDKQDSYKQDLENLILSLTDIAAGEGANAAPQNGRLLHELSRLSDAGDPAIQRALTAANALCAADEASRPVRLLTALRLAKAAERSCADTDVPGELSSLEPSDGAFAQAPFSRFQPLLAALDGSGSGRITILEEAWASHPEYFSDPRVLPHLAGALGDARGELEELLGSILLKLGKRAVPYLKDGCLPDGRRGAERRVYWVARLAGAGENAWYLSILPESRREVRETVIAALGVSQENAPLLLELYRGESDKKCRDAALRALARMEDAESRAFWSEELERRPDCPPCLEGVGSALAADMAARALREAVEEALSRGAERLSRAELLTLAHAAYAAYGKYSDAMRETWLQCAGQMDALGRLGPADSVSEWDLSVSEMLEKCLLESVLWNPCEGMRALAQELGERYPARFLSAAVLGELLLHPAEAFDRYGKYIVKNSLFHRESAAERANRLQLMHALSAVRFNRANGWHVPFSRKDPLTGAPCSMRYRLNGLDPRWAETLGDPKVNRDGAVYDLKNPWSMTKQMFLLEWLEPDLQGKSES